MKSLMAKIIKYVLLLRQLHQPCKFKKKKIASLRLRILYIVIYLNSDLSPISSIMNSNSTITVRLKDIILSITAIVTCIAAVWVIPPVSRYIEKNYFKQESIPYPDGKYYRGEMHNGQKHGKGKLYAKNHDLIYEGDFYLNQFHGDGVWHLPNGERYEGKFVQGLQNGIGTLFWGNQNTCYDGAWENGRRSGFGVQYLEDGIMVYSGQFKDDMFEGFGTHHFSSGGKHIGEFRNGMKNGKGTIYDSNNNVKFDGEFKNGEKHGNGILYDETGDIMYKGIFINGKIANKQPNTTIKPPIAKGEPKQPTQPQESNENDGGFGDILLGLLAVGLIDEAINGSNKITCGTCDGDRIVYDSFCNCNYSCPTCAGYGYLVSN